MRKRWKKLILPMILMAGLSMGAQVALAGETDPYAQQQQMTPSDKRGLQMEDDFFFYYGDDGFPVTGWREIGDETYYFCPETTDAPFGSAAIDFQTIGSGSYYFDDEGVLQTGWQTINGKRYYFATTGEFGEIGRMYTGLQEIDGNYYFFDTAGRMKTGWVLYKKKTYYFNKKKTSEDYGAAYTGWNKISKDQYYFSAKGVMKKDCWISKKYYVDGDGKLLKNSVTPDGYYVDAKGLKGKRVNGFVKLNGKIYCYTNGKMLTGVQKVGSKLYYFKANGVRKEKGWVTAGGDSYYIQSGVVQTGWVVCDGKRYYFSDEGKLVTNDTVDGIELGDDGAAPVSVLLLSGHGQGDPGASATCGSTYYQEDRLTREFSTLIYKQLKSVAPSMSVVMYDQNYDCYQVLSGKKSGPKPNFKAYNYVLEIHFNATGSAGKDPNGNGSCKGTGIYVNSNKVYTAIDAEIVAALSKASGLPVWGGGTGIMRSSGLFNAKTLQAMGVSYGLLETAFIDDRDDMNIYGSKKNDMAKAVATAIRDHFGVEAEEADE